jgi:hypothetical protein
MKSRRPSAGLIVGIIALIVALSGSAVAASIITSAQIKDGSVRLKDINKNARKALKGQRGPAGATGARGPQGPQGAQGAQGNPGAAGANGATNVVVRQGTLISVPNTGTGIVTASCNPGERATGGGNSVSGSTGWQVIESFPTPGTAGSTPTGWRVDATNNTGSANNLVAIVVCASP